MSALNIKRMVGLVIVVLVLSGCAAVIGTETTFKAWRGDETFKGKGGTLEVFDGVEFWDNGEPSDEYVVLGLISHTKSDDSLNEMLFGDFNRQQIIDIVKREGGDGVVVLKSSRFVSGYTANQYGPVSVSPEYSKSSVMAVFKYVN